MFNSYVNELLINSEATTINWETFAGQFTQASASTQELEKSWFPRKLVLKQEETIIVSDSVPGYISTTIL